MTEKIINDGKESDEKILSSSSSTSNVLKNYMFQNTFIKSKGKNEVSVRTKKGWKWTKNKYIHLVIHERGNFEKKFDVPSDGEKKKQKLGN